MGPADLRCRRNAHNGLRELTDARMRHDSFARWNFLAWGHKDFERFWQIVGLATALAIIAIESTTRL
jgi:hypothetical protein